MKIPTLAALVLAAAPALAADSFDTNSSALLAQAREAAKTQAAPARSLGGRHYEPACQEIDFKAGDQMTSPLYSLDSEQWEDVCIPVGTHEDCHQEPVGPSMHRNVRLTLKDRPAFQPGEVDKFSVCLTGNWLSYDVVSSAYEYRNVSAGSDDGEIVLSAVKKKAAAK